MMKILLPDQRNKIGPYLMYNGIILRFHKKASIKFDHQFIRKTLIFSRSIFSKSLKVLLEINLTFD